MPKLTRRSTGNRVELRSINITKKKIKEKIRKNSLSKQSSETKRPIIDEETRKVRKQRLADIAKLEKIQKEMEKESVKDCKSEPISPNCVFDEIPKKKSRHEKKTKEQMLEDQEEEQRLREAIQKIKNKPKPDPKMSPKPKSPTKSGQSIKKSKEEIDLLNDLSMRRNS